jgi:hypothetical protein
MFISIRQSCFFRAAPTHVKIMISLWFSMGIIRFVSSISGLAIGSEVPIQPKFPKSQAFCGIWSSRREVIGFTFSMITLNPEDIYLLNRWIAIVSVFVISEPPEFESVDSWHLAFLVLAFLRFGGSSCWPRDIASLLRSHSDHSHSILPLLKLPSVATRFHFIFHQFVTH